MESVSKIFGVKSQPATNNADAAVKAANQAATLERSQAEADAEIAKQRAQLTIGTRGRRGLLAYANQGLSSTLA